MRAIAASGPAQPAPDPKRRAPVARRFLFDAVIASLVTAAAIAAVGVSADSSPSLMSVRDYAKARRMLDGEMRFAVGECRRLHEDARAICRVQARADDRIRRAELEARYRGTVASQRDIEQARARARHEVGRARPSLT